MRAPFAAALAFTLACATAPATPPPAAKQAWPDARPAPPPAATSTSGATPGTGPSADARAAAAAASQRRFDANPAAWAASLKTPAECEAAARQLRAVAPDSGWRALRLCSQKPEFKVFKRLNDGFWDAELRVRPDAPLVLGAALAYRGGDLGNDLASLRKRKIPIFTLETATSYPDVYKGRQIVFVARVDTLEPDRGNIIVTLSEQALMARSSGQTTEWKGDAYRGQDSHGRNFAIESNEYGHYESKTRYSNNLEETGTIVQARLAKPDPFFEPGRSYLIVARFGGLKPGEGTENGSPVVTIDGYYELGTHDLLE